MWIVTENRRMSFTSILGSSYQKFIIILILVGTFRTVLQPVFRLQTCKCWGVNKFNDHSTQVHFRQTTLGYRKLTRAWFKRSTCVSFVQHFPKINCLSYEKSGKFFSLSFNACCLLDAVYKTTLKQNQDENSIYYCNKFKIRAKTHVQVLSHKISLKSSLN